jgi:hypothetical protein
MRSFDTGATRDTAEGKLDMEGFTHPMVMKQFAKYMNMNRLQSDGQFRDSDNWQKGIPKDAYMKSLRRHHDELWLAHRGFPTTSGMIAALCGIIFNANGYMHEILKESDWQLQDFDDTQPTPEMQERQQEVVTVPDQPPILLSSDTYDMEGQARHYKTVQEAVCSVLDENEGNVANVRIEVEEEIELLDTIPACNLMDEYEQDKILDIAEREDAEARFEKSKQDFLDATRTIVQPIIDAMQVWVYESNEEDLVDVPELPVCFGADCFNGAGPTVLCKDCVDKEECDTHDCGDDTCDFAEECREDFLRGTEDSTHLDDMMDEVEDEIPEDFGWENMDMCMKCTSLTKKWNELPCRICKVNTTSIGAGVGDCYFLSQSIMDTRTEI